jgi:hypothetical protein
MKSAFVAGVFAAGAVAFGVASSGVASGAEEGAWTTTDFIDLQLPPHWVCNEQVPRTCQDSRPGLQQDAMLSLAGKPARENETVPLYLAYLKRPKTWQEENGSQVTSRVVDAKVVTIAGQPWASVLQEDSELRGFRTRYLVTVKNATVVVLTLTARDEKYGAAEADFERALQTAHLKALKAR